MTNGSGIPSRARAHRHPDVDEDLEEEGDHDPTGDDRAERIPRDFTGALARRRAGRPQQERRAGEAPLLGKRGEDEVGRMLGEIVEFVCVAPPTPRPLRPPEPTEIFD